MQQQLIRASALAERHGVTEKHLANQRCEGRGIAYLKLGGRVLYDMADVLAYEKANRVETLDSL